MYRTKLNAGAILIVLLGMLMLGTSPVDAASPRFVISPVSSDEFEPRTDGHIVVWTDARSGGRSTSIYGANLDERREFPIATVSDRWQRSPDVDGEIAVWFESRAGLTSEDTAIRGKNLASGNVFTVTSGGGPPSISGPWVVWIDPTTSTLMGRNIETMTPAVSFAKLSGQPDGQPAISGNRIIWGELDELPDGQRHWSLWRIQIGEEKPSLMAEGQGVGASLTGFDIAANLVVFADTQGNVATIDLASGEHKHIATNGSAPATDGRYIIFNRENALWGYDVQSASTFLVANHSAGADAANGVVAWVYSEIPVQAQVEATSITNVLPSAPQPNPNTTNPNWIYFLQTNHYLASGFRDFWQHNGELAVFGYPLTEEYTQGGLTAQDFERQRFEYHPELAGTSYEVELARLGAEAAQKQGLPRASSSFQPLPASTKSDANCQFFPETGHRLCFGFKSYWQTHGLNLGDPGVSYRESLALFGFPLSEEFQQEGLLVQYFERAVFEYHPGNPDPYRVLLRRLDAQTLASRGW